METEVSNVSPSAKRHPPSQTSVISKSGSSRNRTGSCAASFIETTSLKQTQYQTSLPATGRSSLSLFEMTLVLGGIIVSLVAKHNPDFNYGEFATISSKSGLKSGQSERMQLVSLQKRVDMAELTHTKTLLSNLECGF